MRNRAIFQANTQGAKQQSDQNAGNTPPEERTSPESLPTSGPVGTPKGRQADHLRTCFPSLISKICLDFARCCLRSSRGKTKSSKKKFIFDLFCPDCLKICHDGRQEGGLWKEDSGRHPDSGSIRKAGRTKGSQDIWRACKK